MATRTSRSRNWVGSFDWLTVTLILGGVLLVYYLLPMLSLFLSVSPGSVLARVGEPQILRATITSLVSASLSTVLATVFGLPLAYWLARSDGIRTKLVLGVVMIPLVVPPTVSGIVLLTVIGEGSPIGATAHSIGFDLTRSLAGVVLAQTFVASPFVVVTGKAAFEGIDSELEEAARTLGVTRWRTARRVTLPLALPGVLAGVTLTFARALGEFGATMMVAYYPKTMPVQIWDSFKTSGLENAFPVAIILVIIALCALVILNTVAANPWE